IRIQRLDDDPRRIPGRCAAGESAPVCQREEHGVAARQHLRTPWHTVVHCDELFRLAASLRDTNDPIKVTQEDSIDAPTHPEWSHRLTNRQRRSTGHNNFLESAEMRTCSSPECNRPPIGRKHWIEKEPFADLASVNRLRLDLCHRSKKQTTVRDVD